MMKVYKIGSSYPFFIFCLYSSFFLACSTGFMILTNDKSNFVMRQKNQQQETFSHRSHLPQTSTKTSTTILKNTKKSNSNEEKNTTLCNVLGSFITVIGASAVLSLTLGFQANALQPFVAPPREGDCVECIGVVDDLLASCNGEKNCVSSQDDRPTVFREPWMYEEEEGKLPNVIKKLKTGVSSLENERYQVKILREDDRYIHVEFFDQRTEAIDDMEFYLTPNDNLIQFRASRRNQSKDGGLNAKRLENIRIKGRFEKLPVLRDRKRTFFFVESDEFDRFGPSLTENLFGKPVEASSDFQRGRNRDTASNKDQEMIYNYLEQKQQ